MGAPLKQSKKDFRAGKPYQGIGAYKFYSGAAVFLIAVYWLLLSWIGISAPFTLYLLSLNAALFTLCGFDKSIAGSGTIRVPETALLSLALIGGSAGLLCGMKLFRHKIRSARFHVFIALILIAQFLLYKFWLKQWLGNLGSTIS